MLRGLYSAGAGMITQQRRQEMLTNNLANIETPGYKADQASIRSFPNQLIQAMGTNHMQKFGTNVIGELSTGVYMQERTPNFRQGDLQETFNSTDIALLQGVVPTNEETGQQAALMFVIENSEGDLRYSRNGNFTVDGAGFLTTSQGNYVLDADGDRINVGNEDFIVRSNGEIIDANEQFIAQLDIALIADPDQLVKEGAGLLRYDGDNAIESAIDNAEATFQLQQGFLERANVDAAQTMTEMMSALRTFEANQRVLQAYDRSLERAVNDIGRLR
ncbi:flagellar hook-basal body protein [Evansella cellulosilytica]|uniref:Flagellar hook-basal body protein n=1 Tax=Evansella cellulosilytica (strain ATCC 21833 / DSM 2522 / FERM P-1141 / JCM 9156 / N-4) TaxID=649639 RepID=E6TWL1_EVAC2|nr:flagellar hook-basal body protein [Evansella cellulosilytica]ADU32274.1 flagellar hook-basal body protein [Evansella cellulosilytica DSM 2522]